MLGVVVRNSEKLAQHCTGGIRYGIIMSKGTKTAFQSILLGRQTSMWLDLVCQWDMRRTVVVVDQSEWFGHTTG